MKRELLFSVTKKDFDIQTFCSGGPGGQHQNKTSSGVRIVHRDSGAVGESRTERSQHTNKKLAFGRLLEHPKWKVWHARKCQECMQKKSIEQLVDEQMCETNFKIEAKIDGKWSEVKELSD